MIWWNLLFDPIYLAPEKSGICVPQKAICKDLPLFLLFELLVGCRTLIGEGCWHTLCGGHVCRRFFDDDWCIGVSLFFVNLSWCWQTRLCTGLCAGGGWNLRNVVIRVGLATRIQINPISLGIFAVLWIDYIGRLWESVPRVNKQCKNDLRLRCYFN